METLVGINISSLATANINLFALESPPLSVSTLQCAWVPKLEQKAQKKKSLTAPREHLYIRTSPSCKSTWDRTMGRCCICFHHIYVIYAFTFLVVFCMSLLLGLTNTLMLESNFSQLLGQNQSTRNYCHH